MGDGFSTEWSDIIEAISVSGGHPHKVSSSVIRFKCWHIVYGESEMKESMERVLRMREL